MRQNGSCSIIDQRFLYEQYESEFEKGEGEGVLDPQEIKFIIYLSYQQITYQHDPFQLCLEKTDFKVPAIILK